MREVLLSEDVLDPDEVGFVGVGGSVGIRFERGRAASVKGNERGGIVDTDDGLGVKVTFKIFAGG